MHRLFDLPQRLPGSSGDAHTRSASPFWKKGLLRAELLVEPCCLTRDDGMLRSPLYQDTLPSLWSVTHLPFDVCTRSVQRPGSLFSWAAFRKSQPANMTAVNTAFTVFSGIGFLLSAIPIYWHLDSWQVGTGMYMIWTALGCLVHFVDSIVWRGNAINCAPVWCDIGTYTFLHSIPISDGPYSATRIQIAVAVAWPACNLCIVRRLYSIASATAVTTTRAQVSC